MRLQLGTGAEAAVATQYLQRKVWERLYGSADMHEILYTYGSAATARAAHPESLL